MKDCAILVTGGAGSIGSELVRQLAKDNRVYFFDTNETGFFDLYEELKQQGFDVYGRVGDVRNLDWADDVTETIGYPNYIFHAAALKHVTPSAWSPMEYVKTNIEGTSNVIKFAGSISKLINISTDKVIHAQNIMGATKKVAELMIRDAGHTSVRFGNVLGSRGSVIPIWQRQLEQNRPLTVTDERAKRYFMTIEEACALVISAAEVDAPGGVLILEMGEQKNILQLAKEILGKANKPSHPINMIGLRPGETLYESLMTDEEQERAVRLEDFWLIK